MSQRVPEEALRETVAREFDLVIAEQYPNHAAPRHADLDRVPLTTDALRLAVPLSGSRWEAVDSISGAARLPWVMEPPGAASRHYAEHLCREAGFEPDVRFETDDLQTQIALIESGNAVTILPGLMLVHQQPRMRMVGLAADPRRSVFTATRAVLAQAPAVRACRATLASIVPSDLSLVSASGPGGAGPG
jgi:DNA-binding transcriptional LysR family regulator